jgi:hypothetical protein
MRFIELTLIGLEERAIVINNQHIAYFRPAPSGDTTYIVMADGLEFHVLETYDYVKQGLM